VRQPRVRDRRPADQREAFTSAILPPYRRMTKSLEGLIPWLYLKGVSTGDFAEATIGRLKVAWEADHEAWSRRSPAGKRYVSVRADGEHFNIRLEGSRRCILVLMGATADDKRGQIALADG
jgi:transposase-like protein